MIKRLSLSFLSFILLSFSILNAQTSLHFSQTTPSGDYVSTPSYSELNLGQSLTLEAYIKWDGKMGYLGIISKPSDNPGTGYALVINNGNPGIALSTNGGGNRVLLSVITLNSNQWYHIAGSYDGSLLYLYIDGSLTDEYEYETTAPINFSNSMPFLVGTEFTSGITDRDFTGNIDEVRVWNVVRSDGDILNNYGSELSAETYENSNSGLVLYYRFNEGSGTTANDLSTYQANGSITNATYQENQLETLPVELSSFSAQSNNEKITLSWSTVTESNNAGWEVEVRRFDFRQRSDLRTAQRDENSYGQKNKNTSVILSPSADGSKGFSKIGFIAGKGTTTEKQNYEFQIESSQFNTSSLQFRLKQIDHDGQFSYSNILTVDVTPNHFGLSQNYPNPFNPTTSINYQLPIAGQVRLVVFDLLGREVMTLVNEKKEAGNYTANFNAADLTSGVYFYKLTAGNFSEIKKMMLVK